MCLQAGTTKTRVLSVTSSSLTLFYSSPRKQVVDEILWNLPTAPRKMGWVSPQFDDSRVIIQDLPTAHPPWVSVIHVPYLKGWTRKFSSAAAGSPVIDVIEYLGELNQQHRSSNFAPYGQPSWRHVVWDANVKKLCPVPDLLNQ